MNKIVVVLFMLCLSSIVISGENVSIINLICDPQQYDGKEIIITGFLALDFEGNAVYLYQDDYQNSIYKNGLWCTIDMKKYREYDHKYISLEGVFDAYHKGHFGLWAGSIKSVKRVWEPVGSKKAK
jgi:hypothetical protein